MPLEASELSQKTQPNHASDMSSCNGVNCESEAAREATRLLASAMLHSNADNPHVVARPKPSSHPPRAKTIGRGYFEAIEKESSEESSDVGGYSGSDTGSSSRIGATESSNQPSPVPPKSSHEIGHGSPPSVLPPNSTHGLGEAFSASPIVFPLNGLEIDDEPHTDEVPSRHSRDSSADKSLLIARDSFRGTGTQGIAYSPRIRTESTVISDAGDQQFKRSLAGNSKIPESKSNEPLGEQLYDALVNSYDFRQKGFIPKRKLNEIININSVILELQHLSLGPYGDDIYNLAQGICREPEVTVENGKRKIRSFRAVFALLVILDRPQFIFSLIEEEVSDLDLPLVFSADGSNELRRRLPSGQPSDQRLLCFKEWGRFNLKRFEESQWMLLAPFFTQGESKSVPHYKLSKQHILPFLAIEGKDDNNVGTSRVFMVRIHEEHHDFPQPYLCSRGFAIKELPKDEKEGYKREVEILKKFTGERSHPHIVSLLATYEQFDKYHLIFYRAEGNLYDYLKIINPHPAFDYEGILFLAMQCAGMANGLLRLHRHKTSLKANSIPSRDKEQELKRKFSGDSPNSDQQEESLRPAQLVNRPVDNKKDMVEQFGRHGDLKPENILWYPDSEPGGKGTLKITDFGASELNSRRTKTKRRSQIPNTPTYSPPECYMCHRIIRQSYDIWSLACVYLEFIAWMLGGSELLMEFAHKRLAHDILQRMETDIFFELAKDGNTNAIRARVKPAVIKFIGQLHAHPNCTDYLHDFLELIQQKMLVVEPPDLNKTRRIYCDELSVDLKTKYDKCCTDTTYAFFKTPWRNKQPNAENPLTDAFEIDMEEEAKKVVAENEAKLPLCWS